MALLEVKNVTKAFGGVTAIQDLTLDVEEGEIVSVIGPNGVGKTTLLRAVAGLAPIASGTV